MPIFFENQYLNFDPMKQEMELSTKAPAKIFVKLALFGFVLICLVYASMLLLNSAISAIHS
jgi:hypothetical protein